MLRFGVFTYALILAWPGRATDDLAVLSRAVSDYERVDLSSRPNLKDAIACIQSQAALLPASRPDQQYLAHFRKGVCELVAGRLRSGENTKELKDAVGDFQQAISKWPAVATGTTEVVTGALRTALTVARLHASGEQADFESAATDFEAILARPSCPGTLLMSMSACERYVDLGRLWLGWIRYRQGRLSDAERLLERSPNSVWYHRVVALRAFEAERYPDAVWWFEKAVADPAPAGVLGVLAPAVDTQVLQFDLGRSRLYAGKTAEAMAPLNAAIKTNPQNAQALFLRGRAREMLGEPREAQTDFELASRTAFANVNVPFESGYAHYYRGVSLFRRKDFQRAENEFSSALNFEIAETAKADVQGWRSMAAVAGGACEASSGALREAIPRTSPVFPKLEATQLLDSCPPRAITENRN